MVVIVGLLVLLLDFNINSGVLGLLMLMWFNLMRLTYDLGNIWEKSGKNLGEIWEKYFLH